MNPMSMLRNPYHARTLVRSSGAGAMSEAKLEHAIAWTQIVVLAVCVARARADILSGLRTIEGDLAALLIVVLAVSIGVRAIGWMIRRPTGDRWLPRRSGSWTLGSRDARAK